jgi:hypothetical protein
MRAAHLTHRALFILASLLAVGCTSPEATRQRGGGPGGDPGNRPAQVMMHEGSRQYWKTPVRIGEAMPVGASEQARQLSMPGGPEEPGGQ